MTANEQTAASTIFSTTRPVRVSELRTSRSNAFSERSSASDPAASRTATNISDSATATAAANVVSGTRLTARDLLLDLDRLADRAEDVVGQVEALLGELREADHPLKLGALRGCRQAARARVAGDALHLLEPEHVELLPDQVQAPAVEGSGPGSSPRPS